MPKVLFVKANNRPVEQSVSVKLYETFLNRYKESNPNDEIVELDLFAENLPYYDTRMISGMFKLTREIGEPTIEEKQATDILNKYLNQFLSADKVVFAFPMWNFTIPAVLLTYMNYLCQAGKTFRYTPEGPIGLIPDKKVALLSARGGIYSEGPAVSKEMAVNYVTNILEFFGVKSMTTVIVEGHNQFPDKAEEIISEGIETAEYTAKTF